MTKHVQKPSPKPPSPQGWWSRLGSKITRDLTLFVTGLGLIINEAVIRQGDERYGLLVLYAGMVGLPFVFRGDEIRRKMNGNGDHK